jgi:predicted ATPase
MILTIVTLMVILLIAAGWLLYRELAFRKLRVSEQDAKKRVFEMAQHCAVIESILTDVAVGEADVWIENGVVRAQRKTDRATQIH